MKKFEGTFADELMRDGSASSQPLAFSVYRNTYARACVEALEANFPSLVRLLGLDWFRAAALRYVRLHPPRQVQLLFYGDDEFGPWIQAQAQNAVPEQEWHYLKGVAHLDSLWRHSHAAADVVVADVGALSQFSLHDLDTLVLRPHPAARWAWFEHQPVYSLWSLSREEVPGNFEGLHWCAEGALITRPRAEVQWQALPRAGCVLLDACARGLSLGDAAEAVLEAEPDADLASLMHQLLSAGALVHVHY